MVLKMIQVFIPFSNEKVFEADSWPLFYIIRDEVIIWLTEVLSNERKCIRVWTITGCIFGFSKAEDAILFKLIWM